MVAALQEELASVDEAILALERIAMGQKKRRGRPPLWRVAHNSPSAPDEAPPDESPVE